MFINHISGSPKNLLFGNKQDFIVQRNCILKGCCVVIPEIQLKLSNLHFGYFGAMKAKSLARSFAWWPAIHEGTEYHAQNCAI